MSTRSAESRDNSPDPDGSNEKRASKKRKVLSCYACRNRKMKCDRVYPVCGRCQKTGRADQCTYDPRLLEDLPMHGDGHIDGAIAATFAHPEGVHNAFGTATNPSNALSWKMRVQDQRLDLLERKLAAPDSLKNASYGSASYPDDFDALVDEPNAVREEMMYRGKGFKTQFYGSTSPFSLIAQFRELQSFTREALSTDSAIAGIRNDFKTFRKRKNLFKEHSAKIQGNDYEIVALVPEKVFVDAAVASYFQRFEDTYRILHEPSFWKDYHAFWVQQSIEERPASFATILILLVATTKCLAPGQETVFRGDSSVERDAAGNLIEACDAWLSRQSRKHLTLAFYQGLCLSIFAKRVNCLKMKQDWVNSGDLIRIAIAAGMHRSPSLLAFGRISEYEKEMRRRIWATIMELELQSSIDCGLQSSLCGLHRDTELPANLPDDALSTEMQHLPAARPMEHYTNTAYLTCSARSLPLRIHLMQLVNDPVSTLQYSDVLHYDSQITSVLSSLPVWDDDRSATPNALLDLQLRQFLLILHRPWAKLASKNERFSYSFAACIKTASVTLSLYSGLLDKGIYALNHSRNDVLRTVITLAEVVYHNSAFPSASGAIHVDKSIPNGIAIRSVPAAINDGTSGPLNPPLDGVQPEPKFILPTTRPGSVPVRIPHLPQNDLMAATLCKTGMELMEQARSIFDYKVLRLGTGYMEDFLLSAAIGIMPSPHPPPKSMSAADARDEEMRTRGRQAIDRITGICFRVLARQKDPASDFSSTLRNTIASASPPDLRSASTTAPVSTTFGHAPEAPLQPFIPGAAGMARALDQGTAKAQMGLQDPWDGLQDMQVDLGGWNFPDFWAFDVGGDF